MAAEISQAATAMCKKATVENALNEKYFMGLTRIRRNKVSSISAFTQAMFGIKGMHRSISYLRLMVVARQLIHGSGLGGEEQDYRTKPTRRPPRSLVTFHFTIPSLDRSVSYFAIPPRSPPPTPPTLPPPDETASHIQPSPPPPFPAPGATSCPIPNSGNDTQETSFPSP